MAAPSTAATTTTSLNMVFGNKKSAAQKAEDAAKAEKYWQGEWVCKDCGYIYNRVSLAAMISNNGQFHFSLTPMCSCTLG